MKPTLDPKYNNFSDVRAALTENRRELQRQQQPEVKVELPQIEQYAASILNWLNESNEEIKADMYQQLSKQLFDGEEWFPATVLRTMERIDLLYSRPCIRDHYNKKAYGSNTEEFVESTDAVELKPNEYREFTEI